MNDTYQHSSWINVGIDELFAFHLDPSNIPRISPPSLQLLSLQKPDLPSVGAVTRLKVRQFGWTQSWEVVWDVIEPPSGNPATARLVDRALRSPFASWKHEHAFRADGCGCFLTDRIDYRLPLAPWSAPARPFVRLVLNRIFQERHRLTAAVFQSQPQT